MTPPARDVRTAPMIIARRDMGRVLVGAAAALAFAGPARSAALAPDIAPILSRGTLVVGMTDFDSAPFYFTPDAAQAAKGTTDPEGWDVELARMIAQALDVKPTFVRTGASFNAVVDDLVAGSIDLAISKLSVTSRRAVRVRFTQPTIELRHALLANRLTLASRTVDGNLRAILNRDFTGRVGVIAKSSYADMAKQVFGHADVHEFGTWDDVVAAVERGDVDLAYRDELEVKKLMRQRPELHLNLRSVLITDIKDSIAVAVPSGSGQLWALINVILSQRRSYDANQLLDAYPNLFKA